MPTQAKIEIVNEIQKLVKLELNLCRYEHDIKLEKVD